MTAPRKRRGRPSAARGGAAPPSVRIPLPRKKEKPHGDASTYDRRREKNRLRREIIEP
jgi:hypothetical protein